MSAATPFEPDEDDVSETPDPGDWDRPGVAGAWCEDSRLPEDDTVRLSRRPPLAAAPLCCSA
jgi:hypothetical protein